jgi:CheY-like chemotaxis protein
MKKVLIVDDEESMRLLLRRILESLPGLEFTLADGSDESLRLVADHSYDLILLDLLMPGVGGMEVLTRIRNSKANKTTPVIIASVMADQHTQIACRSLGVSDYVVKPIERQALIKAVKAVLTSS